MSADPIESLLLEAIVEINQELEPGQQLTPARGTVLFGAEGKLDSIGLVTFVLLVEEKVRALSGLPVSLSDDRAMSQRTSPFRSVDTLHAYITAVLAEQGWKGGAP